MSKVPLYTLKGKLSNPKCKKVADKDAALIAKPSTLNLASTRLNPQPSTLKLEPSRLNLHP